VVIGKVVTCLRPSSQLIRLMTSFSWRYFTFPAGGAFFPAGGTKLHRQEKWSTFIRMKLLNLLVVMKALNMLLLCQWPGRLFQKALLCFKLILA
jgi:hypothetical protein